MALTGVNGSGSFDNQKHTLESLNIKEGSVEASIFNQIDISDGKKEGYLNNEQYEMYQLIFNNNEIKDNISKIKDNLSKMISNDNEIQSNVSKIKDNLSKIIDALKKNPTNNNNPQREKFIEELDKLNINGTDKDAKIYALLKEIADELDSNNENLSSKTATKE